MLEDMQARIDVFSNIAASHLPNVELLIWRNAPDMIQALPEHLPTTSLISLDHDLLKQRVSDADPLSGMEVCEFLAKRKPQCPVFLHTANYIKVWSMMNELTYAKWDVHRTPPVGMGEDWIESIWLPRAMEILTGKKTGDNYADNLLWWVIPGILAGMPMPFVHPERRNKRGGALNDCEDDLPILYEAGVRSVVCLLNIPNDKQVYESAGFRFLCSDIPNYQPPTIEQATSILHFIDDGDKAVAVHCEGGIGRTGTILAAYLIHKGDDAETAIKKVRAVEPAAIETASQIRFLMGLSEGKVLKT